MFVIGLQVFLFPVNPGFAMPRVSSVTSSVTVVLLAVTTTVPMFSIFRSVIVSFPAKTDKKARMTN